MTVTGRKGEALLPRTPLRTGAETADLLATIATNTPVEQAQPATLSEGAPAEQVHLDSIDAVTAVCYFAVVRALQFAAQRSTATGRSNGKQHGVDRHLVHTRVDLRAEGDEWPALLRGAWETLPVVLSGDTTIYADVCETYVKWLIVHRRHPDRLALRGLLDDA